MPDPRESRPEPRRYRADAKTEWPHAPLKKDAPLEAHLMRQIAANLRKAMKASNLTAGATASRAGLSRATLQNILNGRTWAEIPTIVALEDALQARLWGGAHIDEGRRRRGTPPQRTRTSAPTRTRQPKR